MADRRLRVGVDGRELLGRPTGVGRYLRELLREWTSPAATPHEYLIFSPERRPESLAALAERVQWIVDAGARSHGTWWEQVRLPGLVAEKSPDVFFAAGYTAPLRLRCPFVVAIYDVSFFAHREWFSSREGMRRRWLTKLSARRAASVVTISEFSASEISRYLGVGRERLRLAPPGAPAAIGSSGRPRSRTVLYVGSLLNRRNIDGLIAAFAKVVPQVPDARLVLVGDNRTMPPIDPRALAQEHGIAEQVEWREYVSDSELDALYQRARVFAFLSAYEGFAMTPFEAIAHGVPAVLLDTPVAREVYGDGARLVANLDGLPDVLTTLLRDDGAHAALVQAGQRRLTRFSWARTATAVGSALEEAAR